MRDVSRPAGKSILILGVIIFIVGGLFYSSIPVVDGVDTSIIFYDADGNAIGTPLAIFAGGSEVVSMKVRVDWIVQAVDIDPTSFNAHVKILIEIWNWQYNVYAQHESHEFNSGVLISEGEYTWVLADLLQEFMTDAHKIDGWRLRIRGILTPTATDIAGNLVVPDPPTMAALPKVVDLTWQTTTASLTVVSVGVNRWIQVP